MKITIYELLGMVKDGKAPKRIMYNDIVWDYIEIEGDYRSRHNAELFFNDEINNTWIMTHLNTTVEIIEDIKEQNLMPEIENFRAFKKFVEENKKELHANNIEFNINNDKRDCIITLDENDLGIDKLHLDNCYFYKENDKWYVKHINLKPIAYISQEHKIPEKLTIGVNEYDEIHINNEIYGERQVRVVADKINEIIDYLEEIE